jgi:hypothetical protein
MASASLRTVSPRRATPGRGTLLAVTFLGLSVLDLVLTWRLLQTPGACFYEANPVASSILEWGGWWGLGLYKLGCAGTVLGVIALLARWRPRLSRVLLTAACPLLALVVGYSVVLASGEDRRELMAAYELGDAVDQMFREHRAYQQKLSQFARAVTERQLTLPQAARELSAHVASLRYNPLAPLRAMHRHLSDEALLAAAVVREAYHLLRESGQSAERSLAWLEEEFRSAYASPLPRGLDEDGPPTGGPFPRRPRDAASWINAGEPGT